MQTPPHHPAKTRYKRFRIHDLCDQRRHALAAVVRCQRRGCGTRVPRTCSVVEEHQGLVSVGVKPNLGRGGRDLNVAGRLADGSRAAPVAGLMICCESRWCGGDRDRGSSPSSGVMYLFTFMDMAALPKCLIVSFRREVATKALRGQRHPRPLRIC
jgi:hypothetical protein